MATTKISLLDVENLPPLRPNKRDEALYNAILNDKNIKEEFRNPLTISARDTAGAAFPAEAAAGAEIPFTTGKEHFEMHYAVVESTGTAAYIYPYVAAGALEVPLDANVTDGPTAVEVTNGITSSAKSAWTVGTDAFYCEASITIDDVSDLDQLIFGFRKAEAYQAEPDNYDELAAWHVGEQTGGTNDDGQINLMTILNGGATSYTDTTETDWADTNTKTLRVNVALDGNVTFTIDGAAPTVTAGFKFDSGEVVVPFFFVENTTSTDGADPAVNVSQWECGATKTNLG